MQCEAAAYRLSLTGMPGHELCERALNIDPRNVRALVQLATFFGMRVSRVQSPNSVADRLPRPAREDPNYRRWLDGLRGVAILAVLAYHFYLLPGGFLGVDIFFVLSGFLITSLLADEWRRWGSISLSLFYLRRALRLLPAFWVLLLVYGLAGLGRPAAEAAARGKEIALAACYVANWPAIHQTPMPIVGHSWSLAVEEQFYIIWPLVFYSLLRLGLGRRWILGLVGSFIMRRHRREGRTV